ncbi:MAG: RND efflux system, outer membrane lipoprotein, NodT family [Candidatus Gallionella acididurans]|uniref:RND efflux system, outer membrane lipoprotein, NodT family n=1 Tax=Candidatus Gallionella acididurans TaxID=1796491 RepID=A0A139BWE4_9PROT|nr:MAG: RND efflux system, outer membrane lipoprotein, NodT family [Candidatus Gallionella acididurans]
MNDLTKKLMPIILAAMLGGCSAMPNYEHPTAPDSSSRPDSVKLKPTNGLELDDWQYYFPAPRLQMLIEAALENNRDLDKATARIARARAQYGNQDAGRLPKSNADVSRNDSRPAASVPDDNESSLQQNNPEANLLSYESDFWGRVESLGTSARASYLDTEPARRAFRLSLVSDVAKTYLSLLEMRELNRLADAQVKACAELQDLIMRRHEAGISSDKDLLQAQEASQAAVANSANLKQSQIAEESFLNVLTGQSMVLTGDLPEGRSLADQGINSGLFGGLYSDVLLRRPDVLAAEQKLQAEGVDIGAARATFVPRITLTGNTGNASSSLTSLFDPGNGAWNFQPAIGIPLFGAGRDSDNPAPANSRQMMAIAQYEKTIQQALREVEDLLLARKKLGGQLAVQQANTESQKQLLDMVKLRYKVGVVSHVEVLEAQRQVLDAEQSEIQARLAWLTTATQLYKALGGDGNDSAENATQKIAD